MVACRTNVAWRRKHDAPDRSFNAATVCYPTGLRDLIELCSNPPGQLKAAGSHYALSGAAISDDVYIETNDPNDEMPAMARTLHEVLPGCISPSLLQWLIEQDPPTHYPVHVEAGKRLYQLYSELDWGVGHDPRSLARYIEDRTGRRDYLRPWARGTMGSAAQQTIVGAFSTGTHGGDVDRPPIADAIEAMHLVIDGGRHLWIERLDRGTFGGVPLVDDASLRGVYNEATVGRDIEIVRDNDLFDAVLVSAGRFGVIYSVVVAAVPQFTLHENTALALWQDVKTEIAGRSKKLWMRPDVPTEKARYLNLIVSLSPIANGSANRVGIVRRWEVSTWTDAGVAERRGDPGSPPAIDSRTGSVDFPMAGRNHAYSGKAYPSMIETACSASGFMQGLISGLADEIDAFVESNGAVVGAGIAAVAALGGGGLLALLPQLYLLVTVIRAFLDEFDFDDSTIADAVEAFREVVMGAAAEVGLPAPTFVWRMLTDALFKSQMEVDDREAVSYAIMDTHDYLEENCFVDVDSLEVFFDTDDPRLTAYVDALISFERRQQAEGKTFFGVAALRFMRGTQATLGPQPWQHTASVEVAGVHGVDGTAQLMRYASWLATDLNVGGFLHWGQRNDTKSDRLRRYVQNSGAFIRWQRQLARLTDDGRLNHFSNEQTRSWGLEIP